jgi:hypothetical protein
VEAAAQHYFELSVRGDTAVLRQSSIPSLATNFGAVEEAVKGNQADFTDAKATPRPSFVLTATGQAPLERAEFLCGVFNRLGQTEDSAVFVLRDLPPGTFAVAVLDVKGGAEPRTLTLVLQLAGTDWKLAGYYVRPPVACGHDGAWFAEKARAFKSKSQNHNAWLYYRQAIALTAPVDFMSTLATDKLYDELQTVIPADMPSTIAPLEVMGGAVSFHWIDIFPLAVGNDFDVEVRYSAADISNTQKTFEQNRTVMKAVLAKFPELRDGFAAVVARAIDPSGKDYPSLLPMKEIN